MRATGSTTNDQVSSGFQLLVQLNKVTKCKHWFYHSDEQLREKINSSNIHYIS